jgi:hypothetical protein
VIIPLHARGYSHMTMRVREGTVPGVGGYAFEREQSAPHQGGSHLQNPPRHWPRSLHL